MGTFRLLTVKGKAVEILARFDNSVLVQFVKTGKQQSINPSLIKSKLITNENNNVGKKKEVGKQFKFKFKP